MFFIILLQFWRPIELKFSLVGYLCMGYTKLEYCDLTITKPMSSVLKKDEVLQIFTGLLFVHMLGYTKLEYCDLTITKPMSSVLKKRWNFTVFFKELGPFSAGDYYHKHYRAHFHGSAYRQILRLRLWFPDYVQAPKVFASLVSVECLVTWRTHAQKPKFAANPWNTLAVSTEFSASVSADSVLTISRAMKLGPGFLLFCFYFQFGRSNYI